MLHRVLCPLIVLIGLSGPSFAEEPDASHIRFGFYPVLGEEIVYHVAVEEQSTLREASRTVKWEHDFVFSLRERRADVLVGEFTMRNVAAGEGASADPFYLIAKAVEDQSFGLEMWDIGSPKQVDWPAIKQRLPQLSDGLTAAAMQQILPMFDANGALAVARPFHVASIGYRRAYPADGSNRVVSGLDLPAFFPVSGSTVETRGGRLEDTEDAIIIWRVTSDRQQALAALGPEVGRLAPALAQGSDRASVQAVLDEVLAGGLDVIEGGYGVYDFTPGLMREFLLQARLVAGPFQKDITVRINRLAPK